MANIIFIALLCLGTALAEQAPPPRSACRDVADQTCQAFTECCTRRCSGQQIISCTEGGISLATCRCTGPIINNYAQQCNATVGTSTCEVLDECCHGLCPDAASGCQIKDGVVTYYYCPCRASA